MAYKRGLATIIARDRHRDAAYHPVGVCRYLQHDTNQRPAGVVHLILFGAYRMLIFAA